MHCLLDSVVLRPWITPTTRHVRAHLDVYRTMPTRTFEAVVASHLRTATHKPLDQHALATYLEEWRGEFGQRFYLQKDAQLDERDTAEFEPLLPSIGVPVSIIWGEQDAWLAPRSPNVCTHSSQAPTYSCCRRQGISPWKIARKRSPRRSSTSSPSVAHDNHDHPITCLDTSASQQLSTSVCA